MQKSFVFTWFVQFSRIKKICREDWSISFISRKKLIFTSIIRKTNNKNWTFHAFLGGPFLPHSVRTLSSFILVNMGWQTHTKVSVECANCTNKRKRRRMKIWDIIMYKVIEIKLRILHCPTVNSQYKSQNRLLYST